MISFEINGTRHWVIFRYSRRLAAKAKDCRDLTEGVIVSGATREEWVEVARGVAVRRPKEPYSKEVARKYALKHALAAANFPIDVRARAWQAYHSRPGGRFNPVVERMGSGGAPV